MSDNQFKLGSQDVSIIKNMFDAKDYSGAYAHIRWVVNDALKKPLSSSEKSNLEGLSTWYSIAYQVNSNDGSFWSEYVRGVSSRIMQLHGNTLSEFEFNKASNILAVSLLDRIIKEESLPSVRDTVQADAWNMETQFHIPAWTWPGTLTDFIFLGGDHVQMPSEQSFIDSLKAYGLSLDGASAGTARVAGSAMVDLEMAIRDGFVDGLPGLKSILKQYETVGEPLLGIGFGAAGKLRVDIFQRGTSFEIDSHQLTHIGLNEKGQLMFRMTLQDTQGEWGPSLVCLPDGSVTATVLGKNVLDLPLGSTIKVEDQSLSVMMQGESLAGTCILQKDTLSVRWVNSSGDFSFGYITEIFGSGSTYQILVDGKLYEGDADSIDDSVRNGLEQKAASLVSEEKTSWLQTIGNLLGVTPAGYHIAAENGDGLRVMADRIQNGRMSNRWYFATLGAGFIQRLQAVWSQTGAISQVVGNIQQSTWLGARGLPSIISVHVLGFGSQPMTPYAIAPAAMMARVSSETENEAEKWVPHQAAVAHTEYVFQGYASMALGQAQALQQMLNQNQHDFSGLYNALQTWMQTRRYRTSLGHPNPLMPVPDTQLITLSNTSNQTVTNRAGKDMAQWLADTGAMDHSAKTALESMQQGLNDTIRSGNDAVVANMTGTDAARYQAMASASLAKGAFGVALDRFLEAYGQFLMLNQRLDALGVELNRLVPVNFDATRHLADGGTFYSPGDASFAAAAFDAYAQALQYAADRKVIVDQLLGVFAQSSGYTGVYLGNTDRQTVLGSGFNLMLANRGEQTFVLSDGVDHLLLGSTSGNVTLSGFQTGTAGDQVQVANVGDHVHLRRVSGGLELTTDAGDKRVLLQGADIHQFDLFANLAGVTTVSFQNDSAAGTRSLRGALLFDGLVHVNELIASNYGDTLVGGAWNTILRGGVGNDTLVVTGTGYTMDGGAGADTVSYAEANRAVSASLASGSDNLGSTLVNIEHLTGSVWADQLTGNGGGNRLDGGAGDDLLIGGGGNDVYRFGRDHGVDTVRNGIAANGGASALIQMASGVTAQQLWFERQDNDLRVSILGTNDAIIIQDWYQDAFRKVAVLELSGGLRIDAAGIESLAQAMQVWRTANPDFDPAMAVLAPSGLGVDAYYRTDIDLPKVGDAVDVALETRQFLQSGRTSAAVNAVNAIVSGVASNKQQLDYLHTAAWQQVQAVSEIHQGRRYVYRYTLIDFPGEFITRTNYDWTSRDPILGRPRNVNSYVVLHSADPGRLYYNRKTKPSNSTDVQITMEEGPASALESMLQDSSTMAFHMGSMVPFAERFRNALQDRQSALSTVTQANAPGGGELALAARNSAYDSAWSLWNALQGYQSYFTLLEWIKQSLDAMTQKLQEAAPIAPHQVHVINNLWHQIETVFMTSTDSAKYQALLSVQQHAQAAYAHALSQANGLIAALAGWDNFAQAQYAAQGQTIQASAGGDLLIAGSGGSRRLIGGTGRDTFLFAESASGQADDVLGFAAGLSADRVWLLRPGSEQAYITQGANGLELAYTTSGGQAARIRLHGISLADMSWYENLVGIHTVDFSRMTGGVSINLDSLTARVHDGYVHVNSITGSSYSDVLLGDGQDNVLRGGAGDDRLVGGAGNNTLDGGAGTDTADYSGAAAGIVADLSAGTASNGFGGTDSLTGIENVTGSVHADRIVGNALDNVLRGGQGNDILSGGGGNDTLIGGVGSDTYLFGRGDGEDHIIENASQAGDTDIVLFGEGIGLQQLWLSRAGNDLLVSVLGSTDRLVLVDWYRGPEYRVEQLRVSSGAILHGDKVQALVDAMTASTSVVPGAALTTQQQALLWPAMQAAWGVTRPDPAIMHGTAQDDTLQGGVGDDVLHGYAGNDTLFGDDGDDILTAGDGNDILYGGTGRNQLIGGAGDDTYHVDSADDVIVELDGQGTDHVQASVSHVLPEHVEHLTLTGTQAINGTGNAGVNLLVGNAAKNVLRGEGGNDMLRGGGGNDTLIGGSGNDIYVVLRGDGMETIIEDDATAGKSDTLLFSVQVSADQLWLRRVGNDLEIRIIGTMDGATIANWYLGDRHRVEVIRATNGATLYSNKVDGLVAAMAGLTMPPLGQLTLPPSLAATLAPLLASAWTGTATGPIVLEGGDANETLYGGSAADTLSGGGGDDILYGYGGNDKLYGGSGANTLIGGAGDDVYYVDSALDQVVELAGEGTDRIMSSLSFVLPDHVENLTLTGNLAINGTGNADDNLLVGNTADNVLIGGAGNDTLNGLMGNDTLIGGAGSDRYLFLRTSGVDRIVEDAVTGDEDFVVIAGATSNQLWFRQVDSDLEISMIGTENKLIVQDWYEGGLGRVERFQSGSQVLLDTQVQNLVNAMAAFAPPTSGQTTLPPAYQTALAPVIAASWQ